jgi:pyridoxine kinase
MGTDMPASPRLCCLSVQSHVVHGYVGNKCATLALNRLGFDVDAINTVQLSNHTGYDLVKGQRLRGREVEELCKGLEANGIAQRYTHVLSGYIGDISVVDQLATFVSSLPNISDYVCDPVFGDDGTMYVPEGIPERFEKRLLPLATVLTPNQFEAETLTGIKINNLEDAFQACQKLFEKGQRLNVVIITSCSIPDSGDAVTIVASCRGIDRRVLVSKVGKIDGYFTGTGDLFAALLLGWLSRLPVDLSQAVDHALAGLQAVLQDTHRYAESQSQVEKYSAEWWSNRDLRLVQNQDRIAHPPESTLKMVESKWVDI